MDWISKLERDDIYHYPLWGRVRPEFDKPVLLQQFFES